MKTLLWLLPITLLAACHIPSATPENKCLDLADMDDGILVFQVNRKTDTTKEYNYKRHYFIEIYEDKSLKNLVNSVFLPKGTKWELTINLSPQKRKNYCVLIYKENLSLGHTLMEWDNTGKKNLAAIWNRKDLKYYASTKLMLPAPPVTITSKDGAGGDGVRVMID